MIEKLSEENEYSSHATRRARIFLQLCPGLQLIYPNTANNLVFTWSADLEREFQNMIKAIQKAVKLSPIDINKKL